MFLCSKSKIYISILNICDGVVDCENMEDEKNCTLQYILFHNYLNPYQYLCNFQNDCSIYEKNITKNTIKLRNFLEISQITEKNGIKIS